MTLQMKTSFLAATRPLRSTAFTRQAAYSTRATRIASPSAHSATFSSPALTLPSATRHHTSSFHSSRTLAMNVARVTEWGQPPQYFQGDALPAPSPTQLQLKIQAVGVPRVVQGRAAGIHSSSKEQPLPFDPSADGVGLDEATGDLYYVAAMAAPMFAERANIERQFLVKLPPGADPATVAGLANPVGSSWMALRSRTIGSVEGKTILIMGATGGSGRNAAKIATALNAGRVIGTSRNLGNLEDVEGLTDRIALNEPYDLPANLGPIHIILDFVGGKAAATVLEKAQCFPNEDLQYIHVGDLGGDMDFPVSGSLLNKKPIRITGSGLGAFNKMDMKKEMPGLVSVISKWARPDEVFTAPMSDISKVWKTEDAKKKRLVICP
ncbi:hypothetical protein F5Y15DRAFT_385376 [Xylariaceae sp. FL0016]|nr:hypothetical protein F5Y15DRAFT_385376 [Xylariaceae sp. FL0016]